MTQPLSGRIVVVTGASRGIGAAAAVALAAAGAAVMLAARDGSGAEEVARCIAAAAGTAEAMACDVSDYRAVERLVATTRRRLGPIDALVNNAAVIGPIVDLAESDPAEWARTIETNLVGPYHAVRAVLPGMIAAGAGTIVNVSSSAAMRPMPALGAYCVGKAGLAMLTRQIAREAGAKGIAAIGFQPGSTDTDMQVTIRASGRVPRQPLGSADIPARAIAYLCTPAAADLSGQEVTLYDPVFRRRIGLT